MLGKPYFTYAFSAQKESIFIKAKSIYADCTYIFFTLRTFLSKEMKKGGRERKRLGLVADGGAKRERGGTEKE
jgi:hypothetical protein